MSTMTNLKSYELWLITGSQHLYGPETLQEVAAHSREIAEHLDAVPGIACRVVFKTVATTPEEIAAVCRQAENQHSCVGVMVWMHTFSPAKMWIAGLSALNKPLLHLHTQYNRDIPWDHIDMDFMNLNQSAHGGREFGFVCRRLRRRRKVVVGHWQDPEVYERIDAWGRAACAWSEWRSLRVARFGDNMREVAVTEGDKVEAQKTLGFSVNGYGVGELATAVAAVEDRQIDDLLAEYKRLYRLTAEVESGVSVREAARIEIGLRTFLETGGFRAFTTTFEDLHGLPQLPGLAVQRLMADGYGFGAEGDWKTAALVRAMKVMAIGRPGGTSFMEDYTYHFEPGSMKVLGAHMLEVCPSLATGRPALQVHPLGIGGKDAPARLVFNTGEGAGLNVALMDLGDRFRLLCNPCRVVEADRDLPKLPVARVLWQPMPELKIAAAAWILAGGAHHTGFSMALNLEHIEDFAEMVGVECLPIDRNTTIADFKRELRINDTYYPLAGLGR